MSCSFSKDFSALSYTNVENTFIKEYMPVSSGDAVKVYLYGLYLCFSGINQSVSEIASTLNMKENLVKDCFMYWEEFGLVSIIAKDPFTVIYYPAQKASYQKPRKIKADKYSDFNKSLQNLFPQKMISTTEYGEYFSVMESYLIEPDAMLLIVKYCMDQKGENVSYRYIIKVAKNFAEKGLTTFEKVEEKLSSYIEKSIYNLAVKINKTLGTYVEINDSVVETFVKKWLSFGFSEEVLSLIASRLFRSDKHSLEDMDSAVKELLERNIFDIVSVSDYFENSNETTIEEYNKEYTRRRAHAIGVAQRNSEKAMELDGFSKLYERMFSIEKDLAFAEISNNETELKLLEEEKISVTEKAQELLKEISLTLDDLSPKYACEKCKDTGYVGTHKCDCFKKFKNKK